jgi:calcineurin-like phosphoesterase
MNAMARLFMETLDNPFVAVDEVLKKHSMPHNVNAIVLDFHGEATSEKMVMGHYCDGRVSLVVGTHTHVPTSDYRILNGGTAYQSDAGMCGDYDSVIGVSKEKPIFKFSRNMPTDRPPPANGEATLCGLLVLTDDNTGLAKKVFPVQLGGCLPQTNLEDIILE